MGLGALFTRSTVYTATSTTTGASDTWTVVDDLAPDWSTGEYGGAMGIPAAWSASLRISELLASFPWDAFRERAGRPIEEVPSMLLEQPNPPEGSVL